jgi:hypothetical protein
MNKTKKRVYIRENQEDVPVTVYITKDEHIEMSKSGSAVCIYTDYKFECNFKGHRYYAESRDDASKAFSKLCKQFEKNGLKLRCCGTCLNFFVDWAAQKCFGGLCGYCQHGEDEKKIHSSEQVRFRFNYCSRQILKDDVEYNFISEHLYD